MAFDPNEWASPDTQLVLPGQNCGDMVAKTLNPRLQKAGLPLLERGGLDVDSPVKMAKATGAPLWRDSQTPFTPDVLSQMPDGTYMVGGTGGSDSHAQFIGTNAAGERGVWSYAPKKGGAYWENFDEAATKIRARGWNNYTATNPMYGNIRMAGQGKPKQASFNPEEWAPPEMQDLKKPGPKGTGFWGSAKESFKQSAGELFGAYGSQLAQRPGETKEEAYKRLGQWASQKLGATGEKPEGFTGKVGSIVGGLPVPLAELGIMQRIMPGGGSLVPKIVSNIAKGAASFGAQSALRPEGSFTRGAIEGGLFGMIPGGWGRAGRFGAGAGIGLGSTYASPMEKTWEDYATGGLVPGILAGLHGKPRVPGLEPKVETEPARTPDRILGLPGGEPYQALPPGTQLQLPGPKGMFGPEGGFTMGPGRARIVPADDLQLPGAKGQLRLPGGYTPDFTGPFPYYRPDFTGPFPSKARTVPADDLMLPGPMSGQTPVAAEPMVTLYRGEYGGEPKKIADWIRQGKEEKGISKAEGRWFTDNREDAEWYKKEAGDQGRIVEIQIPKSVADKYKIAHQKESEAYKFSRRPESEYFLPGPMPSQMPEPLAPAAKTVAPEPTPTIRSELGSEGYIQAKKNPGGFYQLFFRGTNNEIFPGEKFNSPNEARQYWKAMVAKAESQPKESPPTPAAKEPWEMTREEFELSLTGSGINKERPGQAKPKETIKKPEFLTDRRAYIHKEIDTLPEFHKTVSKKDANQLKELLDDRALQYRNEGMGDINDFYKRLFLQKMVLEKKRGDASILGSVKKSEYVKDAYTMVLRKGNDLPNMAHESWHFIENTLSPREQVRLEEIIGKPMSKWTVADREYTAKYFEKWYMQHRGNMKKYSFLKSEYDAVKKNPALEDFFAMAIAPQKYGKFPSIEAKTEVAPEQRLEEEIIKDYPDLQPKEGGGGPETQFGAGFIPLPDIAKVKEWWNKEREPLRYSGHTWDDIKYSVGKYFGATRTPEGTRAKREVTKFLSRWQVDKLKTEKLFGDAENRYAGLDKEGFSRLVAPIQRGGKSPDPAFQNLYDLYHKTSDDLWTKINQYKPLAYLDNYFRQTWANADDPAIRENINNYFAGKPFVNYLKTDTGGKPTVDTRPYGGKTLTGGRGYFKRRVIPDVETGMMLGLEPREPNPVRGMMNDLAEKSHFVHGMELWDSYFKCKQIKYYRPGQQPSTWRPINDPMGRVSIPYLQKVLEGRAELKKTGEDVAPKVLQYQAYAPEEVARTINNWLSTGLRGEPWYDAYRGLVDPLRKIGVSLSTYHLKLMLNLDMAMRSGSHMSRALGYLLTGDGSKAMGEAKELGKTWSGYSFAKAQLGKHGIGKEVIQEMLDPGAHPELRDVAQDAMDAGLLPHSATSLRPLTEAMGKAFKESAVEGMNSLRALARARPLKAIASGWKAFDHFLTGTAAPIMEYAVPRAKMTAFTFLRKAWLEETGKKYGGVEAIPPDVKAQGMYDLARHVDHMMGEINYDALHFNRKLRDALFFAIKYPGWNLGSANWMASGARGGLRTLTGRDTTTLDRAAWRTTLGLMASVGITGLITQYLLTGTFPDSPGDLWTKGIKTGGKNEYGEDEYVRDATYLRDIHGMVHDPVKTIQSKSPDIFRTLGEIYNNSDYFGTDIWDKQAPFPTQAIQFGKYAGKQFMPYSMRSAAQAQTPFSKFGSFVGLTVTPRWLTETPMQQEMSEASRRMTVKRTIPQQEKFDLRKELVKKKLQGDEEGFTQGISQAVAERKITPKEAKETMKKSMAPDLYRFWHSPADVVLSSYEKANAKEKERFKILFEAKMRNKFKTDPEWVQQNAERIRNALQQ